METTQSIQNNLEEQSPKDITKEIETLKSAISGSSESIMGSLDLPKRSNLNTYNVSGVERILSLLMKGMEKLEDKVRELETQKIIEETKIPIEILEQHNILPKKLKRGLSKNGSGYRPILKQEILDAQEHCVNAASTARALGISWRTYRKYATMYGIYNPNPLVRGKRVIVDPDRGKYPLKEILEGKHPNVSIWTVKDKLLRSKYKKPECEMCGFKQRRIGDNKIPLLLNHMDGDTTNHTLDNLKLLCFNCTFIAGRGYVRRDKFRLDAEWIQEADIRMAKDAARY